MNRRLKQQRLAAAVSADHVELAARGAARRLLVHFANRGVELPAEAIELAAIASVIAGEIRQALLQEGLGGR